jgi:2-polyprenyl-3-methyl-5-hydroxy-6-metoxy-1,4-benzoquinol methylase
MKNLLYKVFKKISTKIEKNFALTQKHLLNTSQQKDYLEKKMNLGNFSFSKDEEKFLIKQWHIDPSSVTLPSNIKQIYNSQDALQMNSLNVAEITFKLPYGIAYEQAQLEEYQNLVKWTLQQNILLENKIIIDVGCGFGGLLSCIHSKFPNSKFWGIEYALSAKKRLNSMYPWMNVFILDIQSNMDEFKKVLFESPDVIYCTEVLEHVQYPELVINNLLNLKKSEGSLIITVPNGRLDTAEQHINFWSPESWEIFIKKTCPKYKTQFHKTLSKNAPGQHNLCAIIT